MFFWFCYTYTLSYFNSIRPFYYFEFIKEWCKHEERPTQLRSITMKTFNIVDLTVSDVLMTKKLKIDFTCLKENVFNIQGFLDEQTVESISSCESVQLTLKYGICKPKHVSTHYTVRSTKHGFIFERGDPKFLKSVLLRVLDFLNTNKFFTCQIIDRTIESLQARPLNCAFLNPKDTIIKCLKETKEHLKDNSYSSSSVFELIVGIVSNDTETLIIDNFELTKENCRLYRLYTLLQDFITILKVDNSQKTFKNIEKVGFRPEDFIEHTFRIDKKDILVTKKLHLTYHNMNPDLFNGAYKEYIINKNYKLLKNIIIFPAT